MKLTTRRIAVVGMLGAISIVLGSTPLGFIPIPPVGATIMHIPVIIGAVMEGPIVGLLIGLIFGGFSMFQAAVMPTNPAQVVFLDPMVALIPRLLIALVSYYAYMGFSKVSAKYLRTDTYSVILAAVLGSLTNTVGVLSMIYFRHAVSFAELNKINLTAVKGVIVGIGVSNGVPEAIVAGVIVTAIVKALQKIYYSRLKKQMG